MYIGIWSQVFHQALHQILTSSHTQCIDNIFELVEVFARWCFEYENTYLVVFYVQYQQMCIF